MAKAKTTAELLTDEVNEKRETINQIQQEAEKTLIDAMAQAKEMQARLKPYVEQEIREEQEAMELG